MTNRKMRNALLLQFAIHIHKIPHQFFQAFVADVLMNSINFMNGSDTVLVHCRCSLFGPVGFQSVCLFVVDHTVTLVDNQRQKRRSLGLVMVGEQVVFGLLLGHLSFFYPLGNTCPRLSSATREKSSGKHGRRMPEEARSKLRLTRLADGFKSRTMTSIWQQIPTK